jgi:CHAT domain-containing protein
MLQCAHAMPKFCGAVRSECVAVSHMAAGAVAVQLEDIDGGEEHYRQALEQWELLLATRRTDSDMLGAAACLGMIGEICLSKTEYESAQVLLRAATSVVDSTSVSSIEICKVTLLKCRIRGNYLVAKVNAEGGNSLPIDELRRFYGEIMAGLEGARSTNVVGELKRIACNQLGEVELLFGDPFRACHVFRELVRLEASEYVYDGSSDARRRLGVAVSRLAQAHLHAGSLASSCELSEASVLWLSKCDENDIPSLKSGIIATLCAAMVMAECGHVSEAQIFVRMACDFAAKEQRVDVLGGRYVQAVLREYQRATSRDVVCKSACDGNSFADAAEVSFGRDGILQLEEKLRLACAAIARGKPAIAIQLLGSVNEQLPCCCRDEGRRKCVHGSVELTLGRAALLQKRYVDARTHLRNALRSCGDSSILSALRVRQQAVRHLARIPRQFLEEEDVARCGRVLKENARTTFKRQWLDVNVSVRHAAWIRYMEDQMLWYHVMGEKERDALGDLSRAFAVQKEAEFVRAHGPFGRGGDVDNVFEDRWREVFLRNVLHERGLDIGQRSGVIDGVKCGRYEDEEWNQLGNGRVKSRRVHRKSGDVRAYNIRVALSGGHVMLDYYRFGGKDCVGDLLNTVRSNRYVAFIRTGDDEVAMVELGDADEVDRLARQWRREILLGSDDSQTARQLKELVWTPVEAAFPAAVNTVYICPDGALTGIPWAALPGRRPGDVLLDQFAVAVIPYAAYVQDRAAPAMIADWGGSNVGQAGQSAGHAIPRDRGGYVGAPLVAGSDGAGLGEGWLGTSDVRRVPADAAEDWKWPRDGQPGMWLIVGDVDYHHDDHSMQESKGPGDDGPMQMVRWRPLPHVAQELDALTRYVPQSQHRLLTGTEATRKRVLEALPRARWAHVATHGFHASPDLRAAIGLENPQWNELAAADSRKSSSADTRCCSAASCWPAPTSWHTRPRPDAMPSSAPILSGEDVATLRLDQLELVVLSACESGMGEIMLGEGVFGLQRAFHLAGAHNVLASLWQVDDQATATLMQWFYYYLLEQQQPPVEALRQAQLAVRREGPHSTSLATARGPRLDQVTRQQSEPSPSSRTPTPTRLWAGFFLSGIGQ